MSENGCSIVLQIIVSCFDNPFDNIMSHELGKNYFDVVILIHFKSLEWIYGRCKIGFCTSVTIQSRYYSANQILSQSDKTERSEELFCFRSHIPVRHIVSKVDVRIIIFSAVICLFFCNFKVFTILNLISDY